MADNRIFRTGDIRRLFFDALGGSNSPMRELTLAQLGHPALTGESIYVPDDIKEYDDQVWLHELSGDYPVPDSADTEREDFQPAVFTGYLAPEKLLSGRRKYGTSMRIKWVSGRYEVEGVAGPSGENYLRDTPEIDYIVIPRSQLDWGLLHPTDPPGSRVILGGGVFRDTSAWYTLPDLVSSDLLSAYLGSLAAGQALAVQIEVAVSTGSITYTAGSAFTDDSRDSETGAVDHASVFANYPSGTSSTLRQWGWVKIYYNMTAITEQDILVAPDESGGNASAPTDATYITQTANGDLSAEQSLSSLETGAMVVTNSTGVITSLKHNLAASAAPGATDDDVAGYSIGSLWIDTTADNVYQAVDVTTSNAVWKRLDATGGDLLADGTVPMTADFDNADNAQVFTEITTPSNPATGDWKVYAKADGLYYLEDDGTETGPMGTGGGGGGVDSGCLMTGPDSVTSITNGSSTNADFDTEEYDTASYIDLGSDSGIITIPSDGLYAVTAWARVSTGSGPDGSFRMIISRSGSAPERHAGTVIPIDVDSETWLISAAMGPVNLDSGDIISLGWQNNCGVTVTINSCALGAVRHQAQL